MPKSVAEFSMASFISAYSTALMDIGYFYRKNMSLEKLQKELDQHLGRKNISEFLDVRLPYYLE